jgi:hypothetical protein
MILLVHVIGPVGNTAKHNDYFEWMRILMWFYKAHTANKNTKQLITS